MSNINNVNSNQLNTLIKSMEKNNTKEKKVDVFEKNIEENTKKDFLDLSTQIEMINKQNSKVTKNYTELESKLGIDSNKWGVEAVSDNIFNFAKVIYEKYKLDNEGEDNQEVLDKFYEIAKSSITKGYNEAMNFLGPLPNDVKELSKATYERSLEKLDSWYKNGGQDVIEENIPTAEENVDNSVKEVSVEEKKAEIDRNINKLIEETENMKKQVLELLTQQGVYFEEKETKKSNFDVTL